MKRLFTAGLALILCLSLVMATSATEQDMLPDISEYHDEIYAALYETDLLSLREALQCGVITSTELTRYYLDRIEKYNEDYNCFITICDDALDVAAQRDDLLQKGQGDGLLFGIPIVIKDNMDLAGFHTTNGLKRNDKQIAKSNADVVQYLLNEGAVIIAKGNMSTEAQDALRSKSQVAGETKNAYSKYMAAGGSSGGSAVSVSLNFASASLGTDTNSSLRIPAALAGCVSLRPTFGKISVSGIVKLNGTRDVPGAITRTVHDQAIMLDVLTQGQYEFAKNLDKNALQGIRIGVLKQLSYAIGSRNRTEANIDDEVAAAFENALQELRECGAEVVEISFSNLFSLSDKTFNSSDAKKKEALYTAFASLMEKENVSVVVYPTYLSTPIRSGKDASGQTWDVYDQININNCRTLSPSASIPEITVPIGVHSLGAGIGMEITSLKNSEQLLLDVAYSYTSRYDHRIAPEGAPNDYAEKHIGKLVQVMQKIEDDANTATEPTIAETIAQTVTPSEEGNAPSRQLPAIVYWMFALLAVLVIALALLLVASANRRKRKRRRNPLYQEMQ